MCYSLNEIEVHCRKAARGAGMHWGLAEEAGKAVRWLAGHELPGPLLLAGLLEQQDGMAYETLVPRTLDGVWRAGGDGLCPVITGAALADWTGTFDAGQVIELGPIRYPLLLAFQAGSVAWRSRLAVSLAWDGAGLTVDAHQGLACGGDESALTAATAAGVRVVVGEDAAGYRVPRLRPRAVDAGVWQRLDAFARRTYAPASEASRLSGAGAGESFPG